MVSANGGDKYIPQRGYTLGGTIHTKSTYARRKHAYRGGIHIERIYTWEIYGGNIHGGDMYMGGKYIGRVVIYMRGIYTRMNIYTNGHTRRGHTY